ncbi:MAG: InlB B-repeat-containing protein [Kiritimatiellae bacterium]|nr:InlB B-repeat-containing protein [Kiritimatiellia bacterium]
MLASMAKADTTMTYSGNLPTAQTVLFQNANLLALKGMSLDIQNTFGGILRYYSLSDFRENGDTESGIYLYENNGTIATAQFQWANGYNTTLSSAYFYGLKLRLVQVGNDIQGCVEKVVYNTSNKQYGVDITDMGSGCTYKEEDLDSLENHNGFFTSCKNLVLTFAATESHTVTFVDWDGTVLDTQTVAFGADATPPANPSRSGYVFAGWDTAFTAVTENLTVTAIYRQLFTVTFLDADGTVLSEQTVEETKSATAPDMSGKTGFIGWDSNFSAVTNDMVVTAVYGAIPEAVTIATATGLLEYEENVLIWTETEGTWDAELLNWCTVDGVRSAWQSGATAVFPISAEVTVEGTPQTSRIYILGDADSVTFKGTGAATVAAGGTVCFGCNASVIVEGALATGDGVAILSRDRHDVISGIEGVYLTSEDQLVIPGGDLSETEDLRMHVTGCWYNFNTPRVISTKDVVSGQEGVYNYAYDAATDTATCQVKINLGGGQYITCVKVQFTQKTDGIYAKALYVKHAGNDGSTLSYDRDFDSFGTSNFSDLSQSADNKGAYKVQIYDFFTSVDDVLPTNMSVVVTGNLDMGDSLMVADGIVLKTADEGLLENGTVTGEITLSGDAVLEMSSSATQTMNGKITVAQAGHGYVITKPGSDVSFNSSKAASWELRVAGDSYVDDYRTLPTAESGKGQTWILDGGTLRMGKANGYWGPEVRSDEGLYVEKGGAVRLLSNQSLGAIMGVCVNGGSVTNESTNIDSLLHKMQLNDGALLTGKAMRVGFIDYYETWSYIAAGGKEPSKVSLDEIQIGYQCPAQNKKYVGINFKVEDVTEDGQTDLLVTSPITERQDVTLFNEGFRENLGVWKQGVGTLELASDSTSCATGVFKIEAGTVRFPEAAAGDFGALVVLGDSEIEVARGARITFDASSDFAWTEGKTLVFSGTMGRKSVRIGTSAAALTAEQLAAVKFRSASGRLRPMTIDGDGYLMAPRKGLAISVR